MAKRRPPKAELDRALIADAVLKIAAAKGWSAVTVSSVARALRAKTMMLENAVKANGDFVSLVSLEINRQTNLQISKLSGTPHDRFFDLIMARFDVLQKYRAAVLAMANASRRDPRLSFELASATLSALYVMVEQSKVMSPKRPILVAGLGAVYGWVFFVWRKDTSSDMAKTMAALDKALRISGRLLAFAQRDTLHRA